MKQIDKLAWESAISEPALMRRYPGIEHVLDEYYKAGFRKGREMCMQKLSDPMEKSAVYADWIKDIGESEE
jgi:hypothetical protein